MSTTAISKPIGVASAIVGALGGIATVVAALSTPDTAACVQRFFGLLGSHGAAIGAMVVGLITTAAPIVALYAHPPVPLSAKQQTDDLATHGPAT